MREYSKIDEVFRLPRLVQRNDTRDLNRAVAQTALEFSEVNVFQRQREEFEFLCSGRRPRKQRDVRPHQEKVFVLEEGRSDEHR